MHLVSLFGSAPRFLAIYFPCCWFSRCAHSYRIDLCAGSAIVVVWGDCFAFYEFLSLCLGLLPFSLAAQPSCVHNLLHSLLLLHTCLHQRGLLLHLFSRFASPPLCFDSGFSTATRLLPLPCHCLIASTVEIVQMLEPSNASLISLTCT